MRKVATAGPAAAMLVVPACADSDSENVADTPAVDLPDNKATGTPTKIGLINPEGDPAVSLPGNREAAEAATKYANAHLGEIAVHPIKLVQCANKEDPASAQDCANQTVEAGVSAVVVTTTGQGEAMAPIITGSGIPYIAPNGSSNAELSSPNATTTPRCRPPRPSAARRSRRRASNSGSSRWRGELPTRPRRSVRAWRTIRTASR